MDIYNDQCEISASYVVYFSRCIVLKIISWFISTISFFFTLRNLRPCLSMNQKLLKIKAWNFSNSHLKMNQDEMDQKMSDYDWLKNKWTKKVTRIIKSNIWTYSNNWKRKHTAKKTTFWMGHRCILQKMPNKTLSTWKNAVFIQL